MPDRYLPVPVWNNTLGQWEPIDFRHGQQLATWPNECDPNQLPLPDYRDGDRVQFVRDETCAREGVVRMVLLRGGPYDPSDHVEQIIQERYYTPENIIYIVTARGHDHRIRLSNILGRYLSRTHWER